jgi:hypothetical protein
MKTMTKKSEINSKLLKDEKEISFNNFRIGLENHLYYYGSLLNSQIYQYFSTLKELKQIL